MVLQAMRGVSIVLWTLAALEKNSRNFKKKTHIKNQLTSLTSSLSNHWGKESGEHLRPITETGNCRLKDH